MRSSAAKAATGNVIPIALELPADTLTPVGAFLRLRASARGGEQAFLIESVEQGERMSRYSFLGVDPVETLIVRDGKLRIEREGDATVIEGNPFEAIARHLARYRSVADPRLPPFQAGAVGYVGFEAMRYFEPVLESALHREPGQDDARLLVFRNLIAFDHLKSRIFIIANIFRDEESAVSGERRARREAGALYDRLASSCLPHELLAPDPGEKSLPELGEGMLGARRFKAAVAKIKGHIRRGDIFQCVLSERFELPVKASPLSVYRALRQVNPSPYQFFIEMGDQTLLGASPEMLVRTAADGTAETHPIAGTRPRGASAPDDRKLERELLKSVKERAEHLMLVDLGRNDIGRVSAPGSVEVPEFMRIERFSHVMHLTSVVRGRLARGATAWEAFGSCFPAGTLSGAPKIRAVEILAGLEGRARGFYGGAVLRYDFSGTLDSCITIRSMMIRDGVARIQAGAGIVADSRPEAEYQEVLHKLGAIRRAIALAESRHAR